MGYTYLICSRSKHEDQLDSNGLPKEGCPYCKIEDLRAENTKLRTALENLFMRGLVIGETSQYFIDAKAALEHE